MHNVKALISVNAFLFKNFFIFTLLKLKFIAMKKLFTLCGLLLCLSAFTPVAKAQSAYFISATNGKTLDTLTNTQTKLQTLTITGYNAIGIEVDAVSLTGTLAGTVTLWASNTGVAGTYVNIPTLNDSGALALESITFSPSVTTKIFRVPATANFYTRYQVKYVSATTQTTTFQSYAVWRTIK